MNQKIELVFVQTNNNTYGVLLFQTRLAIYKTKKILEVGFR